MPPDAASRYRRFASAKTNWDPVKGGKRPLLAWDDKLDVVLSRTASQDAFDRVCDRVLSGHYYPPDAIECYGPWMKEGREIRPGDRMLQRARLFPWLRNPGLWSMTEIFAAERSEEHCALGYVTTERHFGRGIWHATLVRKGETVELHVRGTSGPGSRLFWLGLPVARYLQKRAWRRAAEEFEKVLS